MRAALESIAFQTRDVLEAMIRDSGLKPGVLRVDGGASRNNFLMQFQANLLGIQVLRPMITETTALGAAMLAARAAGLWDNDKLQEIWAPEDRYLRHDASTREKLCAGWQKAVERAMNWADNSAKEGPPGELKTSARPLRTPSPHAPLRTPPPHAPSARPLRTPLRTPSPHAPSARPLRTPSPHAPKSRKQAARHKIGKANPSGVMKRPRGRLFLDAHARLLSLT